MKLTSIIRYFKWMWAKWTHSYCDVDPKTMTWKRDIPKDTEARICTECASKAKPRARLTYSNSVISVDKASIERSSREYLSNALKGK